MTEHANYREARDLLISLVQKIGTERTELEKAEKYLTTIETKVPYENQKQKPDEGGIRLLLLHKFVRILQLHHAVFSEIRQSLQLAALHVAFPGLFIASVGCHRHCILW